MARQAESRSRLEERDPGADARPFVGRERELAELRAALAAARAGRGSCALITGEPGIGKSRLADEFATIARNEGVRVLWGRAWEAGGAPAYWPWVQSLRPLMSEAVAAGAVRPEQAALLAQVFPGVRPDGVGTRLNLDEEGVRFRLFEALGELLRAASGRQLTVLNIENGDAADTPSLLLLRFVGGILADIRALVLVTYRDVALARNHPLRPVIADLLRYPSTFRLTLRGLTVEDVGRYVEAALGRVPSDELVHLVHQDTEGNPLFVSEVAGLLAAERGREPDVVSVEHLAIPETVRETIQRRLEQFSEPLREALAGAAVLGRDFSSDVLGMVTGIAGVELLTLLNEAVEARIVAESADAPGRFRFAHVLFRDTLYEALPPSRRVALHLAAAAALETQYAGDLEGHAAELAHHHLRAGPAGDPAAQIRWAQRAAELATRALAYEEGARLLEQALQVLVRSPDERSSCELLLELGDARARGGDAPGAREAFLAAADLARHVELPELLARAALGYGGRFVWEAGRGDPHLVQLLRDAIEALADGDKRLRAKLLARLAGGPLRDDPRREERDRLTAQAVDLARHLADPALLAYALVGRYAAVWWPDNLAERLELARELIGVSRQAGDREHELQAHHYLCLALLETGDIVGARSEAAEQLRLARELRQPAQSFYVATLEAMFALLHGRFDGAEELIGRAHALGQRAEPTMARIYQVIQLHALRRAQGRLGEVVPQILETAHAYPTYIVLRCVLVDALRELGRADDARLELAALAADRFAALALNDEWVFATCLLGEAAADLGIPGEAEVLREQLEAYRGRVALSAPDSCFGAVDRVLGLLDQTLGNEREARKHLEAAVALNRSLDSPPWTAAARFDLARLLLRSGGGATGRRRCCAMSPVRRANSACRGSNIAPWPHSRRLAKRPVANA